MTDVRAIAVALVTIVSLWTLGLSEFCGCVNAGSGDGFGLRLLIEIAVYKLLVKGLSMSTMRRLFLEAYVYSGNIVADEHLRTEIIRLLGIIILIIVIAVLQITVNIILSCKLARTNLLFFLS